MGIHIKQSIGVIAICTLGFWGCDDDETQSQSSAGIPARANMPVSSGTPTSTGGNPVQMTQSECDIPGGPSCAGRGGQPQNAGQAIVSADVAGQGAGGDVVGGQASSAGRTTTGGQTASGGQMMSGGQAMSGGAGESGGLMMFGGRNAGGMMGAGGEAAAGGQPAVGGRLAPPAMCDHPRSNCGGNTGLNCPAGWTCMPLPNAAGAPCSCIQADPVPARAECRANGNPNDPDMGCCENADCGRGICQQAGYTRRNQYCGGIAPEPKNECVDHECITNEECAVNQVCIPTGALGFVINSCVDATCRVDADCVERPGGECRPLGITCGRMSFYCTYAGDVCRSTSDCQQGQCVPNPNGQGTQCEMFMPPPAQPPGG